MTPPSTALTTLLNQFGLTTAAEELVPRLTQAGHHDALDVLLEVFEAEAEARRQRRAARLPPGKTVAGPGRAAVEDGAPRIHAELAEAGVAVGISRAFVRGRYLMDEGLLARAREVVGDDERWLFGEELALPCTRIQGWTNQLPPCSVTAWSIRTRYYRPFVRLSRKLASSGLWRRRR